MSALPAAAHDEKTLRFYAAEAPVYTAAGPDGGNRHLHGFLDRLASGARILELGCGGGRDCEAMLARGYRVDPTDGVEAMARKAEQRIGVPVRVMRFDELAAKEEYDAVWASASLLHVPRPALPSVLATVHRALKRGGLHYASYKAGGTEGRDRFGRYFNNLSLDQALDAYRASADWAVLATEEYEGGGYEGGTGPWIALTMRRERSMSPRGVVQ
ncbi:MAG: class I SAM-dependent methyltransferase [Sphingomicrobium sp.]